MKIPVSIPASVRTMVRDRDRGRCVRCWGAGTNVHHRRSRRIKDAHTHCPCNLLTLCGSGTTGCHGWVTEHPQQARELGLVVSAYSYPHDIAVKLLVAEVYLDCDGGKTSLAEAARIAISRPESTALDS